MEITVIESRPQSVVLALGGRIDAFVVSRLRDKIDDLFDKGLKFFVLDLTDVSFLDSAGLATLVSLLKRSQQEQGGVRMILPRLEAARRILQLTRFDQVFKIEETTEAALRSF